MVTVEDMERAARVLNEAAVPGDHRIAFGPQGAVFLEDVSGGPYKARVPWGRWSMASGAWTPNPALEMSADEQHGQNEANGYSCRHRYATAQCPICKATEGL